MSARELLLTTLSSGLWLLAVFWGTDALLNLWDAMLIRRFQRHVHRCRQLKLSDSAMRAALRVWSVVLIFSVFALALPLNSIPFAVTLAILGSIMPNYVFEYVILKREQLLTEQLTAAGTGLANAIEAGLSIPQALAATMQESPTPLQAEFRQIVRQFQHGRPIAETLCDTRSRLALEPFTLLCSALEVASERGGRVNATMKRLSSSLQEWGRLRGKMESETASGRYAVLIMACCPPAFLLLFALTGMQSVGFLLSNFTGQIVLSVVLILIFFGYRWACRITQVRIT